VRRASAISTARHPASRDLAADPASPTNVDVVDEETSLKSPNDRKGQQRVTVTEWLAVVLDAKGKRQFMGTNEWSGAPFTIAPGSATKFHSEHAALHAAYTVKEHHKWITDVKAESVTIRRWLPAQKKR
jgi:hypothetical protein